MFRMNNWSANLWVSSFMAMLLLASLLNPVQSLAVHPAVLKNFVGPYRVLHNEPILRQSNPFERPESLSDVRGNALIARESYPSNSEVFLEPRQAGLQSKMKGKLYADKAISECDGSTTCRRNMDSTLNILMKMMETGR